MKPPSLPRGVALLAVWGLLHLLVLLAALACTRFEWPAPPGAIPLLQARWQPASGDEAAGAERQVSLPDDWRLRADAASQGRYLIDFELAAPAAEPWALMIESVRMNVQPLLDGQVLGDSQAMQPPLARGWMRPHLYTVPASLLPAGRHRLELRLAADAPGRGYLAQPWLGTLAALQPAARRATGLQQTLPRVIAAGLGFVGLLMLLLGALRRQEPSYALYGLGMLAWGLHNLNFIIERPPLPARAWDALAYLSLGLFVALATRFIHRVLGLRRPLLERGIAVFVAAGLPLFMLLPDPWFRRFGEGPWNGVVMGMGLWLTLHVHAAAWHRREPALHLLALGGTVIVVFGGHDLLVALGLVPWGRGYLLHYAAAPVLATYTVLLVWRFAQSLAAVEGMNEVLNQRVALAGAENERNQTRLRELERGRWLADERERIAQDMHDGVGSQLVALLAQARGGELAVPDLDRALVGAMADLRLVIDSLEVAEGDLATALASFRHRLDRRLDGTGMRLQWQPGELPRIDRLGPGEILQVLRLLDEAATNALRHSGATRLGIRFGLSGPDLHLDFSDDGRGGAHDSGPGYGLRNMQRRAAALGGTLVVSSDGTGTRLRLCLPLGKALA